MTKATQFINQSSIRAYIRTNSRKAPSVTPEFFYTLDRHVGWIIDNALNVDRTGHYPLDSTTAEAAGAVNDNLIAAGGSRLR